MSQETLIDYSPRMAACEARLRLAGARCATISDHGSRYFDWGRNGNALKIRVADHPLNGERGFWNLEVRVDLPEIGVCRVHDRVRIVLTVEEILHVRAELERPPAAQGECAGDAHIDH